MLLTAACCASATFAEQSGWERKEVNWRVSANRQIKAIYYPADQNLPLLENQGRGGPVELRPISGKQKTASPLAITSTGTETSVLANVINSPPIDGFVPYVAVGITDASSGVDDYDAYTEYSVAGDYLTGSPQSDYAIGIFDTGSSTT